MNQLSVLLIEIGQSYSNCVQANLKKKDAARMISRSARSGLQFPVGRCMCKLHRLYHSLVFVCVVLYLCPPDILGIGNSIAACQGSSELEGGRGLSTQQQES